METIKSLKLIIEDYEFKKGSAFTGKTVFYKIKITAFPGYEWNIDRRYSEFFKLAD